jgi:hypothetical protein
MLALHPLNQVHSVVVVVVVVVVAATALVAAAATVVTTEDWAGVVTMVLQHALECFPPQGR